LEPRRSIPAAASSHAAARKPKHTNPSVSVSAIPTYTCDMDVCSGGRAAMPPRVMANPESSPHTPAKIAASEAGLINASFRSVGHSA